MSHNEDFNDIRPYTDNEVPVAINSLLRDPGFVMFTRFLFPTANKSDLFRSFRSINTIKEFQIKFALAAVESLINRTMKGVTFDKLHLLDIAQPHLFISNHRDIILDSALLNYILHSNGFETAELAIGENLLVSPFITNVVKLNKSFTVMRSGGPRELYDYSKRLSAYIRHTLNCKKTSVWIAQREGRAKDSDDRTQTGLLKMLMMAHELEPGCALNELHLTPFSVTYEYDPCDMLKAVELYYKEKQLPFEKTPEIDTESMLTGISGPKGRVHIEFSPVITDTDVPYNQSNNLNDWLKELAAFIDTRIHQSYMLWPTNYLAYDLLNKTNRFKDQYTAEESEYFVKYLSEKAAMAPSDTDKTEIIRLMQVMYAFPLRNKLGI